MAEPNLHTNHRQRMMEKLRKQGIDAFADHEVLELTLYLSIPRGDTNPAAHRLLRQFGSLHAVFEAPVEALARVEGIGPRSAQTLHFLFELFNRYQRDRSRMEREATRLTTAEKLGAYFIPQFVGEKHEKLLAAYLDNAGRVLQCEEISGGGTTHVAFDLHKIVRFAFLHDAAGVVLAHNHPNGELLPSDGDLDATRVAADTFERLNLHLIDHILVAGDRYRSLAAALWPSGRRR